MYSYLHRTFPVEDGCRTIPPNCKTGSYHINRSLMPSKGIRRTVGRRCRTFRGLETRALNS